MNMSPENKAHFEAKKEAIHLILTGIGDEIYSTIDACQTAQEMWEAIDLYGLKQAPRAWFQRFAGYATRARFYHSRCDSLLFIYRQGSQKIIGSLNNEFDMTDLGAFNYFLGISANRTPTGLLLSQKKHALQLFERAHMVTCNPSQTPVDTESKLGSEGAPVQDPNLYRRLAGGSSILLLHLRNLLRDLHSPLSTATLVYNDKVSVVYMSGNPVQHQRTQHIDIDIHFVRDMVTASQVRVLHVPSRFQYANIFTKGLPSALFEEFRSSLSVRPSPAPTARAY
uniref:Ribonuclease H-like domain-containing protein n=1 Tax=Tanacetum cinerariifolium TaxID=118510 RepID=A0A6L2KKE8_TANCI|nr:ribonuclease H-like domain-containing protein [Tanacetum cinerariifolium]